MANKSIPIEALVILNNHLSDLPTRSPRRQILLKEACELYGISASTLYRAMRKQNRLSFVKRSDYNSPRILDREKMRYYCELIAALKIRTMNKKGRHLSTKECIRLLEEYGIETTEGLVISPKGLLKRSTMSRYLKRWGMDHAQMLIEPAVVRFQATHSNECWQFDFSPSDLKKFKTQSKLNPSDRSILILASVVDDRSGVCYQEYQYTLGEDAVTALRFLFNAMSEKKQKDFPFQGIPKVIYMDNGPVAKSKLFKRVMGYLGIEIRTHQPKGSDGRRTTSRSKGKVERPFRTVKDSFETLYHFHEPETLEEANTWLQHYLQRYCAMPHRLEEHSRMEDWVKNLPAEGFRKMCSWERFRTFAREPESRKVGTDGCVMVAGICYQLSHELAGQDVVLLWGLFDQELYVENGEQKYGPFYPSKGPIPFNTYKKFKTSATEKRADKIANLAKEISIPRSALLGIPEEKMKQLSQAVETKEHSCIPFSDPDPFHESAFKNAIEAKLVIASVLGYPLARLDTNKMTYVNQVLSETLDKKIVLEKIRHYFSARLINLNRGEI